MIFTIKYQAVKNRRLPKGLIALFYVNL